MIRILITGFFMALADSVPGVSGGTIVFIMGLYEPFLTSMSDVLRPNRTNRGIAIRFLLRLGAGWIVGMLLAAQFLGALFTDHIYAVSSVFLGFVASSIPLIVVEERPYLSIRPRRIALAAVGALLTAGLSQMPILSSMGSLAFSPAACLYAVLAGALAISAMVLPGISGSSLLMTFGLYIPVITGLHDALHGNFRRMWLLVSIACGVLAGVFLILRGLKTLLVRRRGDMDALILGMMAGSLVAIVNGPKTLAVPRPPMTPGTFRLDMFLLGCLALFALSRLKNIGARKDAAGAAKKSRTGRAASGGAARSGVRRPGS